MPVEIPLSRLRKHCDPFTNPWGGRPFTVADVEKALSENRLRRKPFTSRERTLLRTTPWTRREHLERIAWLVANGWDDPVSIDVGVPTLGGAFYVPWKIVDGNHRVAAAVVQGRPTVEAEVSGCVETAYQMFGVRI